MAGIFRSLADGGTAAGADVDDDGDVVTGVIVTPVTLPVMAAFCFLLVVPRASRVALAFAARAASCAVVKALRGFLGLSPKSASVDSALLYIAVIVCRRFVMKAAYCVSIC
jgi:hypothetical protein